MNDDDSWLPLLSVKPFAEFTPEDFKAYIRSLFKPRVKKQPRVKKRLKLTVRRLKKGNLSVKTKRSPPYITREEYDTLCLTLPENELFIALKGAGVLTVKTHEEADEIKRDSVEIPP